MSAQPSLARRLSLPLLTLYGVGTIVGGGFYALLGEVASHAGMRAPLAFLVAAFVGFMSALSFGELAARYPVSAGESRYVAEAFHRRWLSIVVGWLVIATGVVSAAMLANAFVGFLQDVLPVPTAPSIAAVVTLLAAVAIWGIGESAMLASVITAIEVGGILFVVYSAKAYFADLPGRFHELLPPVSVEPWYGILLGGFLALYALIGFEDMVNVAEEVRRPRRTLPVAIVLALGITTVLYLVASTVAVLAVPPDVLAESRTPLARVAGAANGQLSLGVSIASMLAGLNGALVQLIMASRILYGMATRDKAPVYFSAVSPRTRTPIRSTVAMAILIVAFSLWLPLVTLARLTSGIILFVFALVNLSLVVLKRRNEPTHADVPTRPLWVPILGAVLCLGFLLFQMVSSLVDKM